MEVNEPLLNDVGDGYVYCRHVRIYLADRLAAYSKGLKELSLASGYSKIDKFKVHCAEWSLFQRAIPLKYLDAIGATIDEIEKLLMDDLAEFEAECQVPQMVSDYTVRILCAIYKTERFDPSVSEEVATEIVKTLYKKSRTLSFPSVRTGLPPCGR